MAALSIEVQFGGFVGGYPPLIQSYAYWRESELVIGGGGDKHGWRVGGDFAAFLDASTSTSVVASFDPLGSGTVLFAALTGVLLWI